MAKITSGVFPVNQIQIEIGTTKTSDAWTYVTVADMESCSVSVDTGVETWIPMELEGWQRSLATSKSAVISLSGKRHVGDAGNDFIAGMLFKNGQEAYSNIKMTFPNGDVLTMDCVISITDFIGGDSTNVAPLGADFTSNGKPTLTQSR